MPDSYANLFEFNSLFVGAYNFLLSLVVASLFSEMHLSQIIIPSIIRNLLNISELYLKCGFL